MPEHHPQHPHSNPILKWGSLVVLSLALAIIIIDTTLLNVSLTTIIRELHTYGKTVVRDQKDSTKTQHRGLGKQLMSQAELVARAAGYHKIAVISSIGTRYYYRKLGYQREGLYMTKVL